MQYATIKKTIAGRPFSLETGRVAKQADGAVFARFGDSIVLCTVCHAAPRPGLDFFPLSVEYREKTYAAGKFPGGFIKREGRPKDKEILTCRLIDRPVRPLWPEGYKDEIQVMATVVSADPDVDPDVVAMNGCFAALHASKLPFQGPVAAVRVGRVGGELVAFPSPSQLDESDMEIMVAASRDAVVMVEGRADEATEDEFLEVLDFAREVIDEILDAQDELKRKARITKESWDAPEVVKPGLYDVARRDYHDRLREAIMVQGKHERYAAIKDVKSEVVSELVPADAEDREDLVKWVKKGLGEAETEIIRRMIVDEGLRIDGRELDEIRPIDAEVGLLPRTHGSSLFTRGETQGLVTVTLGTPRDQQIVDGLLEEYSKRFDLHYNFPPYCVGEVKPLRGVSRREIGHGNLAERALAAVVPSEKDFPYTIRVVSEVTESNGSSSMATVCGGTLAMMDAGVVIRQPVAGIAMGLIKEGREIRVLSDILGTEDHLGDMDFKVAGTGRGITAVQMDIKIKGLSREVMKSALEQARVGRKHILREMMRAISRPRTDLSAHAPRLHRLQIPTDRIGMIIGPGGAHIKRLQEETGARVEIEDDGTVIISATDAAGGDEARARIEQVTAEVEVGRIYDGRVVSIKDFGAFIEVLPGQEGLCHISELAEDHVREVGDVLSVGDRVPIKVLLRDEQGRLKLSRKAAMAEGGEAPGGGEEAAGERPARPRRGRDEGDERPPRARRSRDDEDERPARARRSREDEDERPARPRRSRDDEDERPARARRSREDEDERPARARRSRDDEDDRPARGRRLEVDDEDFDFVTESLRARRASLGDAEEEEAPSGRRPRRRSALSDGDEDRGRGRGRRGPPRRR